MSDALPHDPYITAVIDALTTAGLGPDDCWTSCADEYDSDDCLIPSAVLSWTPNHPAVDATEFDHGIGVYWNSAVGWECARRGPYGTNEPPYGLGPDLWGAPKHVVTAVREYLALVEHYSDVSGEWERAGEVRAAVEAWSASFDESGV